MTVKIASRLDPIKPSITLAVTAKAGRMKAEGIDVISFGAGEPDFDTPDHIKAAVREGLDKGVGKYTDVAGLLALRKAVATEMSRVHNTKIEPENVLVSAGAKHSLFNLFMAMIDPGDEVIIPAPYWVSYPDMVMLAGGTPVILPTKAEDDFAVTAAQVAAACTPKTRAIVLNNPSNPTGSVYTRAQVEALARVVVEKDILVISDDIYRSLVYAGAEYVSIAGISQALADRTVLIDGVSKTYAMTGWRIGYTIAPIEWTNAMVKLQSHSATHPTSFVQYACACASERRAESMAAVSAMLAEYEKRKNWLIPELRKISGFKCAMPEGAFYAFVDVRELLGDVFKTSADIGDYLLNEAHTVLTDGASFGAPGFLRLSYATSMENLENAVGRMKNIFESKIRTA